MAPHTDTTSPDCEPTTGIEPLEWEDLLPPTTDNTTTWDFAPFLTAPAVRAKSGSDSQVNLINIPRTIIPSPFASNLAPRQLMDIKESLVGRDGNSDRGKEIWLSWKRAWDIWNNHYIEGRINPIWIRQEWEERETRKKEWDAGRYARRRAREKRKIDAAGGHPPLDPNHNPLLPEKQLPKVRPLLERGRTTAIDLMSDEGEDSDDEMLNIRDDCDTEMMADELKSDSDSEPPPKTPDPDGSSGGYRPLKTVEEYKELAEEEDDGMVWVDAVANTVWSPRRVEEKTVKIDLDDDIEAFRKKADLHIDGGVDCSRSPYPVSCVGWGVCMTLSLGRF